jgi:hypothetical protein
MSQVKQIEEMAKVLTYEIAWDEDEIPTVNCLETAKRLYCEGYRKVDDIFDDIFEGRLEVVNKRSGDKLKKASDVEEKIFAEIEKQLARYSHLHRYAEEAREVTEEYADGTPCEMTSVWEVISLHKNGWDDYETMCKLQDNIGNIEKSRLLKEFEGDIAELKKKFIGKDTNVTTNAEEGK